MRKIDLNTVMIDGQEYPIFCDMYVLSQVQERMSISEFERDILGAVIARDEKGEIIYADDGSIVLYKAPPKISTLIFALMLFINEGLNIKDEQDGTESERVTEKELARLCNIPYTDLSKVLHDEFNRCFETKKKETIKATKKRTSKST